MTGQLNDVDFAATGVEHPLAPAAVGVHVSAAVTQANTPPAPVHGGLTVSL